MDGSISIEWYNMSGTLFKKTFKNRRDAEARIKEIGAMDLAEKTKVYTLNIQAEFDNIMAALKGE